MGLLETGHGHSKPYNNDVLKLTVVAIIIRVIRIIMLSREWERVSSKKTYFSLN